MRLDRAGLNVFGGMRGVIVYPLPFTRAGFSLWSPVFSTRVREGSVVRLLLLVVRSLRTSGFPFVHLFFIRPDYPFLSFCCAR